MLEHIDVQRELTETMCKIHQLCKDIASWITGSSPDGYTRQAVLRTEIPDLLRQLQYLFQLRALLISNDIDPQEIGIYFMPTDTDEETLVEISATGGWI